MQVPAFKVPARSRVQVSHDGQKFLINTQLKTAMTPMSVVLNCSAKLSNNAAAK
jgi:hypothetical protein